MRRKRFCTVLMLVLTIFSLAGTVFATETFIGDDVTPPIGRLSVVGSKRVGDVEYVDSLEVQVEIYAKDDKCSDEQIKYYITKGDISSTEKIENWRDYKAGTVETITLDDVGVTAKISVVLKDKNGNTSKIFTGGNAEQKVIYDSNGGSAIQSEVNTKRFFGAPFVVTSQEPKRDGYFFLGWNTDAGATVASYRGGDIIHADEALGSDSEVTLYAVWTTDETKLPTVSEVLKVGDYVNYPVNYDSVSSDSSIAQYYGWRVISKDVDLDGNPEEGTINLVSAGVPLTYEYNGTSATSSVEDLTDNFLVTNYALTGIASSLTLTETFSNKYTVIDENGKPRVRAMVKRDLDNVYDVSGATVTNSGTPVNGKKYDDLLAVPVADTAYEDYWLATANSNNLWYVDNGGAVASGGTAERGVRIMVSLREDAKATGTDYTGSWNIKMATCKITFEANGGSGTMAEITGEEGSKYTLPSCGFTAPDGKAFDGWEVNGTVYSVGNKVAISGNTTVTAQWKTVVNVDGLGNVEVSNPDAELTYDPDTGELGGAVPPAADEPETPVEIPEENLPEIIEFGYGTFEAKTEYTPGTYETVEYETTHTRPKYPVSYQNVVWSEWSITKDAEGNIISTEPGDMQLADIGEQYSTYIVYDFETDEALESNGVKGDSVELWTIFISSEDSLENAVYLAAYLNKADGKTTRHIAKWDGTKYVAYDADAQISAINTFTETYTVTETKQVQITAPSSSTEYVYIPAGNLKAEKGMTWVKWLESEYNTTGETEVTIKTSNYVDVSKDAEIVAGEKYGFALSVSKFYIDSDTNKKVYVLSDTEITNSNQIGNANISEVLQAEGETTQVPIPTGFTYYLGTGDTGLVVKDGSGNEFVWIPVNLNAEDEAAHPDRTLISDMYGTGTYTLAGDTGVTTAKYGKHNLIGDNSSYAMVTPGTTSGTSYREPDLVTSYDTNTEYLGLAGFSTTTELANDLVTEFNNMITSVEKYGGFFVGRYELGYSNGVVCKPGVLALTSQTSSGSDSYGSYAGTPETARWYGLYNASKTFTQGGVTSSMIWGTQWDAMVNYIGDHTIAETGVRNLTGESNDHYNHVHDTSTNLLDWTATAYYANYRAYRGGYYNGTNASSSRSTGNARFAGASVGTRAQLYIKN